MRDELTPREVADELGVTVRTVQRWITSGRLPASRVGGRMRVHRSALPAVADVPAAPRREAALARPIRSLLIANRGEIAIRIARTARALGLRVVRIHQADEPPSRGPDLALAVPSYLDQGAIVDAARRAGADAVHPGYGFLAENAEFAEAVTAGGLVWVGPPAAAIAAMGEKAAARRLAARLGIPVVPGYDDDDQADDTLEAAARRIGFPLLLKPSAGGGGKGMRVVRSPDEFPSQLAAARREASAAFGDDRLVLERLLEGSRHVEVQVLVDAVGAGVHLGERDCSAQRRNQKIVEESPGPSVNAELRQALGTAALTLAEAVGYVGAGTVEFLVTDEGSFHFLEMNTRLQVEHPVTEAITGRDLVADQLRIAAGEFLGVRQADVRFDGHAIEARLYAEDPEHGFLPATGTLVRLRWPEGVRVDAGVEEGDEVSDRFDPLLAKVIAHGRTRADALERLRAALDETEVLGVVTNLRFLRWLLAEPAMGAGEVRNDTLARLALPGPVNVPDQAWSAAAGALATVGDPWAGGWRMNLSPVVRLTADGVTRTVPIGPRGGGGVAVDGNRAFVDVEGQSVVFAVAPAPTIEQAVREAAAHAADRAVLRAPMPGRVVSVAAGIGASVALHQPVVVLEAMKMEHAVASPVAGSVVDLAVRVGQVVQRGDLLAEIAAAGAEPRIEP